jgi:hypothetical protein
MYTRNNWYVLYVLVDCQLTFQVHFKVMVPSILNNGNFVQLDDTILFDTFIHTLHVSGIYHPSSGYRLLYQPLQFAVSLLKMGDKYPR